jgi:hypothetical protein
MSNVVILRKVGSSLVEILALDSVSSHSISYSGQATKNPIEDGSEISDHVQIRPVDVVVTGLVTNTPISFVSGPFGGFDGTRAKTAYDALVQTHENIELVQVQDELDVWPDMTLVRLDIPRDRSNFNALEFTATFSKLSLVGTLAIALSEDVEKVAAPKQEIGRQVAEDSTEREDDQASYLVRILKGTGAIE